METKTTEPTPQTEGAKTICVTREHVESLCNLFKIFCYGDFETIQYRLKEIAFCIGQCDKGTNELAHLMETLQDIDNILGFLCVDELQGLEMQINTSDEITLKVTA